MSKTIGHSVKSALSAAGYTRDSFMVRVQHASDGDVAWIFPWEDVELKQAAGILAKAGFFVRDNGDYLSARK